MKTALQDDQGQEGIPILGEGIGQGSVRAPSLNAHAGASHPTLALHDTNLPKSRSAAPWKTSTNNQDPANPGTVCGEMTSPHLVRRNQGRNKYSLMWMRSWAMIPHCPGSDPLPSGGCH